MTAVDDKETTRIRLRFIDLFKSFFVDQPDAEKLGRWRGIISALIEENIDPAFDQAVRTIDELLAKNNLRDLRQEHYQLFVDPFGEHLVHTSASFYRDGHAFGPTLIQYRDFLQEAGIKLHEDVHEPDDSLVLILDALATLVEREQENLQESRRHQGVLVNHFLLPLCLDFTAGLRDNPEAVFYQACAELLCRYMDLEKGLFPEPAMEGETI
ncbi:MAG TPA: hypothetical protein ENK84_13810 [Desulfobulbus sp.]|nr:hypothetical protein [Desulfobulbus sp.]